MGSFSFLKDEPAFQEHCKELDRTFKYYHLHDGTPDHYPCIIHSEFYNEVTPHAYAHSFLYLNEPTFSEAVEAHERIAITEYLRQKKLTST
jgi:hypothetical protein